MIFSTVGYPQTWELTEAQIALWQARYAYIDVRQECLKALSWTEANHKKTARGMMRFLVNWLNVASDRRRGPVERRAEPVYDRRWQCPHIDRCSNRQMCESATILGRPVRQEKSA